MRLNYLIKITFIITAILFNSCSKQGDITLEYDKEGRIRYVEKCQNLSVKAGWGKFYFNWDKNTDPTVEKIKIVWESEGESGEYIIPMSEGSFVTPSIYEDKAYSFKCYTMNNKGELSLPVEMFSTPFSYTHRAVLGFPRVIDKYYFIGNDLIFRKQNVKDIMDEATLSYSQNNEIKTLNLIDTEDNWVHLKDIDIDKPICIDRIANVEGCVDQIVFKTITLDQKYFSLDLELEEAIKMRYNLTEVTIDWARAQKTLDLDYDLSSLSDILYFTSLETLNLGGKRYILEGIDYSTEKMFVSKLHDVDNSVYALNKMRELLGIELNIYNNNYGIQDKLTFTNKYGSPTHPVIDFLDSSGWSVSSSSNEGSEGNDPAEPDNILDNDHTTQWRPESVSGTFRTHILTIDMKENRTISGFKVTQPSLMKIINRAYFSNLIKVEIGNEFKEFKSALPYFDIPIGQNYGESTFIYLPKPVSDIRYIRIILQDKNYKERRNSSLGDFMVF